jgi:hypothetical protein
MSCSVAPNKGTVETSIGQQSYQEKTRTLEGVGGLHIGADSATISDVLGSLLGVL